MSPNDQITVTLSREDWRDVIDGKRGEAIQANLDSLRYRHRKQEAAMYLERSTRDERIAEEILEDTDA